VGAAGEHGVKKKALGLLSGLGAGFPGVALVPCLPLATGCIRSGDREGRARFYAEGREVAVRRTEDCLRRASRGADYFAGAFATPREDGGALWFCEGGVTGSRETPPPWLGAFRVVWCAWTERPAESGSCATSFAYATEDRLFPTARPESK
jgi:hypothetical protein